MLKWLSGDNIDRYYICGNQGVGSVATTYTKHTLANLELYFPIQFIQYIKTL